MIWRRDPMGAPAFEAGLRKTVRAALARKPAERKRARAMRPSRLAQRWWVMMSAGIGCAGALACAHFPGLTAAGQLGITSAAAFCLALIRRQMLWAELHTSPDLLALTLWPAPAPAVFERQSRRGLEGRWICDLMTIALCAGLVSSWELGIVDVVGLLLAAVLLRYLTQALAAVLCLSHRFLALGQIGVGLLAVQMYLMRSGWVASRVAQFWNSTGDTWSMLPTGWVLRALQTHLTGGDWRTFGLVLPAAALLTALPWALARIRARYHFRDAVLLQYAAEPPGGWDDEDRAQFQSALPQLPPAPTQDLLDRLKSRDFLAPQLVAPSALDRLYVRWLTPRERVVAEWAQGGSLCLARNLRNAALVGLGGAAVAFAFRSSGENSVMIVGIGVALVALGTLKAGAFRRPFEAVETLALRSPRFALAPVTLVEVARLQAKAACVLLAGFALLMCVLGGGLEWMAGEAGAGWWLAGLRLAMTLPGWALLAVILQGMAISRTTWRGSVSQALLLLPAVLGFIACVVGALARDSPWAFAVAAAADLMAVASFAVFRWIHQRHHFDLLGPRE